MNFDFLETIRGGEKEIRKGEAFIIGKG